ncbi:MAG: restriction endonuclease subunit M [Bacteroidota bacterium]
MITRDNFQKVLTKLGFTEDKKVFSKPFGSLAECVMTVNWSKGQLIYPESIKINDRTTCNFEHPENFVVFECVHRLLEKGYRPEHIELEKRWNLGHDSKSGKADICVYDKDGQNMLFIVECKTYGKEYDKALKILKEDGGQLFSYWQQERSTKWISLYASDLKDDEIVYKNDIINCSDDANIVKMEEKDKSVLLYKKATTVPEYFETWSETYGQKIWQGLLFGEDTQAYKIGVRPLRKSDLKDFDPDDKIVNRFEEILRHNNVSDKENAFNRLVALFICKLVDEIKKQDNDVVEFQYRQGTDTYETLQDRLQRLHTEGMQEFMGEKIFYVSNDYAENLFKNYTNHKRERAIEDLKNTIRILKFYSNNDFSFKDVHNEELFFQNGKILVEVVQLFENHRIVYPSKHQFLGDLFEQLLNKGFKQSEGQFFTPTPITRFIWDSLPLAEIPKVIDYACGSGHFLTEAVESINNRLTTDENNSWVEKHIFGIEKDYRLARVSKISLFMNGAGGGNIIFGDGLENQPEKHIENNAFDILVANPPYSVSAFKSHLKLKNNSFELLNRISNDGSEIETLFVERIAQLLKPQGVAAVVLPSSILSNDSGSYTGAREILLKNFLIRSIVQFGSKTFGATGTNTVVLFLEKYNEPPKQSSLKYDSANAIIHSAETDDWEDGEILRSYLQKIHVTNEDYRKFTEESVSFDSFSHCEYLNMYADAFLKLPQTVKSRNSNALKKTYCKRTKRKAKTGILQLRQADRV